MYPILRVHLSKCESNLLQNRLPRYERKGRVVLYQRKQIGLEVFEDNYILFFDFVYVDAETRMAFKLVSELLQKLEDRP
jgi:hypothetical protein